METPPSDDQSANWLSEINSASGVVQVELGKDFEVDTATAFWLREIGSASGVIQVGLRKDVEVDAATALSQTHRVATYSLPSEVLKLIQRVQERVEHELSENVVENEDSLLSFPSLPDKLEQKSTNVRSILWPWEKMETLSAGRASGTERALEEIWGRA